MTYRGFHNTMHQVWIRTDALSCLLKTSSESDITNERTYNDWPWIVKQQDWSFFQGTCL